MSLNNTKHISIITFAAIFLISCNLDNSAKTDSNKYRGWSSYLGGPDRNHYSTLSQITLENVTQLKMAWSYSAPDSGQMQMNPIVVDTILYGVTAALRAVALDAGTGKEIWRFGDTLNLERATSRGMAYWEKNDDKRILFTQGTHLFALNALTGTPISSFGENGKVDLHSGLPSSAKDKFVSSNTPGTVYKDLIVMPIRLSEGRGAAPGDIMAFNVITGQLEWVFHTIPYPGESGNETWEDPESYKSDIVGAANNWAGMALDEETGILYVPTGSAAPDFFGGDRKGSNLYANTLLALNAQTGKLLWHYQFTHHDLWDRDPPAPPNLLTINREGQKIAAVAQVTKQGFVFLFNRATGEPLFDIEEIPVPPSTLEGEKTWATQPFPTKPKPFARQSNLLTDKDLSPYAENKEELLALFNNADKRIYAPPSLDPVLLLPGYDGAAEWGGAAADPEEGILYVNSNEMAWFLQMKKDTLDTNMALGKYTYNKYCIVCHQKDMKGDVASGYPSLIDLKRTHGKEAVALTIKKGKGMMTGFPQIKKAEMNALLQFLYGEEMLKDEINNVVKPIETTYKHTGYKKFLDSNGLPAISPPWGTLHAIDLNSGDYIWSIPFGETMSLKEKGFPQTGSENYGGAIVTENGLLFIGATKDGYFRAFNKKNGKLLWEYKLPAPAFATPAMYEVNGKQFIAIACGGEKLGTEKGNMIIAFSLE
ncbi:MULTISPECIES: pyrroloquinoline quinone-dependent dehydrogenase [unclassified Arenibacter]|uniref:pyrroloquinoline quinone-dependent dehydrogenase n=1 Tax=unclassified Arenibacter TaxID=2615047 RepID=UPI000E3574FA|nr:MULTISPECIES: pyrroloquinoline quinone-dependent dehydrogenase [unclassified Arenibacter]MCM4165361.1 pyrrolo-quinoline quinone [Arenibacter sp. A80]RFT54840.1 pyrroloquinoline quinone-dependent dehydrogenase [Arenibacter sp. P308M17]